MSFDEATQLKLKNYKSFGETIQGFDKIAPINIIIGRNNSGKSTLIDLVDFAISPRDISSNGHNGQAPAVYYTTTILNDVISMVFPSNTGGGVIGGNHYGYGKAWIGKPITIELGYDGQQVAHELEPVMHTEYVQRVARKTTSPFKGKVFKRILAERNIKPEQSAAPGLEPDGTGVSNLVQYFLHESTADQSLIEDKLLRALNKIFYPVTEFSRIQAKRLAQDGSWEIYLEEKQKGSIALSNSGSGLKTIFQVLAQTILIPSIEGKSLEEYVFGFEELENNLHAGLQRKLLMYLRELAIENNATFFIATHSNVVIDIFSHDDQAQILHVTHDGKSASVRSLIDHSDGSGLLDDLDIRASDLLQSNGIIWVEGPSDRTYINHCIDLCSNGELKEGLQYQVMFYGGKLLARVSADPKNNEQANLLKINRNSSIVIDSDKRSSANKINATKARLKKEISVVKGHVWITRGKEIENEIPLSTLQKLYGNPKLKAVGQYQPFDEYLNRVKKDEGKRYLNSKPQYAEEVIVHMDANDLDSNEDLKKNIEALCAKIKSWNNK